MGIMGMNVDELRHRAAHLNAQGAEIANVVTALQTIFAGDYWLGVDAKMAKHRLHDDILPSLERARDFIGETSERMVRAAQDQESVSGQ